MVPILASSGPLPRPSMASSCRACLHVLVGMLPSQTRSSWKALALSPSSAGAAWRAWSPSQHTLRAGGQCFQITPALGEAQGRHSGALPVGWPSLIGHPIPISDGTTEAGSLPQIPGVLCRKHPALTSVPLTRDYKKLLISAPLRGCVPVSPSPSRQWERIFSTWPLEDSFPPGPSDPHYPLICASQDKGSVFILSSLCPWAQREAPARSLPDEDHPERSTSGKCHVIYRSKKCLFH